MNSTSHQILLSNSNSLNNIKDETIHLVVTSPPYPMIEMWDDQFSKINQGIREAIDKNDGMGAFKLMHDELARVWREIHRITKPGGIVCINIGDATRKISNNFQLYPNHVKITEFMNNIGFHSLPSIIWRKQSNKPNKFMGSGMLPVGAYVTLEHEYILIFRKGERRQFINEDRKLRQQSAIFWEERNAWFSDIWFDLKGMKQKMKNNESRTRSAAFPIELVYRLINMYSIQGDWVFDPFLGTGTTTLAAMISSRNSIGYELEKNLTSIIHDKLSNAVSLSVSMMKKRIASHLKFIDDRLSRNKQIKHTSANYGFPVISKQSINMKLHLVSEIKKMNDTYTAIHVDIKENNEINQLITLTYLTKNKPEFSNKKINYFFSSEL